MFTAYFNALTLVNDSQFNTLIGIQLDANRHFYSHTSTNLAQLERLDTSKFNVILLQLTETPHPALLIQLIDLGKHAKLVIIADDPTLATLAFEIGAIDFITTHSPLSRLNKCFDKLIHLCPLASAMEHAHPLTTSLTDSHLIVKDIGKVRLIEIDDIIWINGAGNYVELHFWQQEGSILHRETMKNIEQQLAPAGFIRVHRSTLVKQTVISELAVTESGDYKLKLKNGVQLNLSRRYKNSLSAIL
ncbi:LytR/AlgR family response regulator transcription factor [Pseudoalteromonas sp. H105]|jgi:two-component system LytT family response regulator|uniref:LytR/AlgR family response regulator transcription factor n=1 Tax=Pseudoalteromonas sp. H105 TaxID=1348393 RepID=UPI0007320635|nr:response regulator transcription factor [Pseudoalteromonas sp. H105]KTF13692.1 LytTR family transcriptional regulator [Pseudoalteromonas sp. H105]